MRRTLYKLLKFLVMEDFLIDRRYFGFRYPSIQKRWTKYPPEEGARYSLGYYRGRRRIVFDYFMHREHALRYYDALKERYPSLTFDILPVLF